MQNTLSDNGKEVLAEFIDRVGGNLTKMDSICLAGDFLSWVLAQIALSAADANGQLDAMLPSIKTAIEARFNGAEIAKAVEESKGAVKS